MKKAFFLLIRFVLFVALGLGLCEVFGNVVGLIGLVFFLGVFRFIQVRKVKSDKAYKALLEQVNKPLDDK